LNDCTNMEELIATNLGFRLHANADASLLPRHRLINHLHGVKDNLQHLGEIQGRVQSY
jgi:hypothetical protein